MSATEIKLHDKSAWEHKLPQGWCYKPLTDLVSEIVDNRGRSAPTSDFGIPLIATNCIKNDGLYPSYEKIRYVSKETYRTWFRSHPIPGDIIIVNKGTPGLVCMVPDPVDFCFAQDMVAIRPKREIIDGEYLFAALRSPYFLGQVQAYTVGTTVPHLKKDDFPKLLVPFPPRSVQEFIGHLYCDISRKIELNHKTNKTLEQMALALYKHWFVDFGPFRDGEFVDSELGRIPKGWEVGKVSDLCEFLYGKGLPESMRISGLYPVYGSAGIIGKHNVYLAEAPGIIVGRKGTIGKLHRARLPFFPIDTTYYVKPKAPEYGLNFLFLMLGRLELEKRNADLAVPGLNRNDVYRIQIVKPPKVILEEFNAKVSSMFSQIDSLEAENQTLAQTRDYLLPKLLSWEIEVKETEKIIGNMA